MRKFGVMLGIIALSLVFCAARPAEAVSVQKTWTGPDSFNTESISFPGFTADSLTGISGNGALHSHSEGVTVPFALDILLNGSFVTLFSSSTNSTSPLLLSSLLSLPLTFPTAGTLSGLRLSTPPPGEFHSFSGEVFTFNSPVTPPPGVPEPAAIFFLISGVSGVVAFKLRCP